MQATSAESRAIPKVNFRQAEQLITIADLSKRPLIVRGKPGGGKTEATRSYVRLRRAAIIGNPELLKRTLAAIPAGAKLLSKPIEEQVYGYIDFRLTYFDPTDIKGFPLLDKEAGVARWLPPASLPLQRMVDAGEIPAEGMWGLEELANAPRATQAAIFQAVLDREVAGEPIAAGWCIVATSNSIEDMSVVNPMPAPLVSRFSHCELNITTGEWCDWAMRAGVNDKLVSYFKFKPDALFNFNPKNWVQDTPYCCPRSVEMLSDALAAWDASIGDKWPLHLITSYVGTEVGKEFYAYIDIFQNLPSVDEVVKDPMTAKLPTEASAIYAICCALARKADSDNLHALYAYFGRFEKAYEIAAIKDVNRCHPKLSNHPAFNAHVRKPENREIYLAIQQSGN